MSIPPTHSQSKLNVEKVKNNNEPPICIRDLKRRTFEARTKNLDAYILEIKNKIIKNINIQNITPDSDKGLFKSFICKIVFDLNTDKYAKKYTGYDKIKYFDMIMNRAIHQIEAQSQYPVKMSVTYMFSDINIYIADVYFDWLL